MSTLFDLIPSSRTLTPGRNIFDHFFEDWDMPSVFSEKKNWVPAFDITENEKEYIITAELPGIDAKALDVTFTEGILSVKGEKKKETEDKSKDYHRIERCYGSFYRSFRIPGKILVDKVDSSFKDGVLKLTLPKSEESESKKIKVE